MRKWRLHIIGLGSIISIVVIMFWASGALNEQSKPINVGGTDRFLGERFIQITGADWGRNCNRTIANHNTRVDAAERDFNREGDTPERIPLVAKDNALLPLSRMCDGKLTCEIGKVKTSALGMEPLPIKCSKQLELRYRCFEFDRTHEIRVKQNKTLRIDCRAPKKEAE